MNHANSKELFGLKLYQNAKDVLSIEKINKNKSKDIETKFGYFNLLVNRKTRSPYFEKRTIIFDENFMIHQIRGISYYDNYERCKTFLKKYILKVERKENIKLLPFKEDYGSFTKEAFYINQYDYSRDIGCVNNYDSKKIYLYYVLRTDKYSDDVRKYYDQD